MSQVWGTKIVNDLVAQQELPLNLDGPIRAI